MEEGSSPQSIIPILPSLSLPKANMAFVQRIVRTPFELDVILGEDDEPSIEADELSKLILDRIQQCNERFATVFNLKAKGFSDENIEFAQRTLSNLVGGVGYFHGALPVHMATEDGSKKIMSSDVRTLISATPSRRSFPRAFLWDEGFHQLLLQKWDPELSREILNSWLQTMTESGWIPREQTRGAEAVHRFPSHIPHFMVQSPDVVNPPTLLMAIRALSMSDPGELSDDGTIRNSLSPEIFARLYRHIMFLAVSQQGNKEFTFYWRGRSKSEDVIHTLASGLDDYPRAENISDQEMHLDLTCWVSWALESLSTLAPPDMEDIALQLQSSAKQIRDAMPYLFAGDNTEGLLCDQGSTGSACHEGYVTLFPLLLGLEDPSSPRLGQMLDTMRDENKLWSAGGLRSLSKTDEKYGKNDGYWTGPVWLPINYMALAALKTKYSVEEGPNRDKAATIYEELRRNIVNNVIKEFERTGTVWEQYNPDDGVGQRGPDFTGWTSIIVLIMAEAYDGVIVT
eukprot:Plantae.Rhodophyta-Purpureofilum_apyrenoidigerum.ctg4362.p1 GENE.Plantae.Rhodophyta-Purpureofilum_apyrenoidigerum.ctg4362~~Plantae.Rhodophyta-Purpureofilum_apyrenoidigerum.ctg4362.p1  ORF type:complete len:562 (+),score=111.49 Plantae.Rhodophyta-Purpureofilum_apyrenoidigerum.ctg4362:149-1687(+)